MERPCKDLMMEKSGTMRRGWHRGLVVLREVDEGLLARPSHSTAPPLQEFGGP